MHSDGWTNDWNTARHSPTTFTITEVYTIQSVTIFLLILVVIYYQCRPHIVEPFSDKHTGGFTSSCHSPTGFVSAGVYHILSVVTFVQIEVFNSNANFLDK